MLSLSLDSYSYRLFIIRSFVFLFMWLSYRFLVFLRAIQKIKVVTDLLLGFFDKVSELMILSFLTFLAFFEIA